MAPLALPFMATSDESPNCRSWQTLGLQHLGSRQVVVVVGTYVADLLVLLRHAGLLAAVWLAVQQEGRHHHAVLLHFEPSAAPGPLAARQQQALPFSPCQTGL